ncbi:MAG TPA: hypothetical protein VN924_21410 [Bryobacteraceae bacterium]|nr:hypothetical protein [Bryobacteraceae bacterium]
MEKRHPAYTKCFNYVARVLGNDSLALRAFIPLTNAAFETSDPVRAFARLLQLLWGAFRSEETRRIASTSDDFEDWRKLFTEMLDDIPYEAETDADAQILASRFFRLTWGTWLHGSFGKSEVGSLQHPMLPIAARQWEEASQFSEMMLALDHPGALSARVRQVIASKVFPPITAARFHLGNAADRVVV